MADSTKKRLELRDTITELINNYRSKRIELLKIDQPAEQLAHDTVVVWRDVLSDDFIFADRYIDQFFVDSDAQENFADAATQLSENMLSPQPDQVQLWCYTLLGTLEDYLQRLAKAVLENWAQPGEDQLQSMPSSTVQKRLVDLASLQVAQARLTYRLRSATKLAEQAVDEARQAAVDARDAAGYAAESTLTKQFEELANQEADATKTFRALTVAMMAGGVVGALLLHLLGSSTPAEAIFNITVLAGIFGLATYFGRQAAHHRDLSTWARTIAVQLLTFDAYSQPVTDDQLRNQMRAAFAARVFGSSPEGKDDTGPNLSASAMGEFVALMAKAGR